MIYFHFLLLITFLFLKSKEKIHFNLSCIQGKFELILVGGEGVYKKRDIQLGPAFTYVQILSSIGLGMHIYLCKLKDQNYEIKMTVKCNIKLNCHVKGFMKQRVLNLLFIGFIL